MNVASLLVRAAARHPDVLAIAAPGARATFAELEGAAARAAGACAAAGLRPGDRILVVAPLSVGLYAAVVGALRAGLVVVLPEAGAGRAGLDAALALAPRAFAGSPRAHLLRLVAPALRRVPVKLALGGAVPGALPLDAADEGPVVHVAPDAPALLTFTSGSTGRPKAAVRTHGLLLAQHRALTPLLEAAPGAPALTALPVVVLSNLALGVTSVLPDADLRRPGDADGVRLVRQIERERVARILAPPALLARIGAAAPPLPGIDAVLTGGGPVFPRLLDDVGRWAPRARRIAVYGSTEAEPVSVLDADEIDRESVRAGRGLPAGRPVAGLDVRIARVDDAPPALDEAELARRTLPAGEVGEILVAGDHVVPTYLDGPGDTKIRVGARVWHRTGDAGALEADGTLRLLGRLAARVEDARGVAWPFAVEAAASEEPWVARAALVGAGGRRLLAVEPATEPPADAAEALRARLAFAGLDEVRIVRAIPVDRRHNSKVDYTRLRRTMELPA